MNRSFPVAAAVFFGGVTGTSLRFAVGEAMVAVGSSDLAPVLAVNIIGALALGWFGDRVRHAAPWSTAVVAFVGVGLLGSFTTFSAFSVESVELFRSGSWVAGAAYVIASILGGFAAARTGARIGAHR